MANNEPKHQELIDLIGNALEEMQNNQIILLKRGDLLSEDQGPLYKRMYDEIKEVKQFLTEGGSVKHAYRYLQLHVFMKEETFFMNLFETQKFPVLFDLFEFE